MIEETAEHASSLSREMGSTELVETRFELRPGQHGQAGVVLQDRHEDFAAMQGQRGDSVVRGIPAESTGSFQGLAQFSLGEVGFDPEPFREPFQGMVGQSTCREISLARAGWHVKAPGWTGSESRFSRFEIRKVWNPELESRIPVFSDSPYRLAVTLPVPAHSTHLLIQACKFGSFQAATS